MDNCIRIRSWSPFHFRVIIIDTKEYVSTRILTNYGIRPWNIKRMSNSSTPFRLVECSIRKKDVEKFIEALEGIRNSILVMGYRDYDQMCDKLNMIAETNTNVG